MKQKEITIKNKIANHLTKNGKKSVSETILLKSIKEIQKVSSKQTSELIKLAILFATPIFKLHTTSNKKRKKKTNIQDTRIPTLIQSENARTSLAIKFLVEGASRSKKRGLSQKLTQELINGASQSSNAVEFKRETQKGALTQKHFLKYFRGR